MENRQVGWTALTANMEREAGQWARVLPVLPRLLHQALVNSVSPAPTDEISALRNELKWLRRCMVLTLVLLSALSGYLLTKL